MIRNALTFSIALAACALMAAPSAQAQCSSCGGGTFDADGMVMPTSQLVGPVRTIRGAARDNFSPHRVYAHSNSGLQAANTHSWNMDQQNVYSWHGGYQNWRWGTPTALVVPPTASYQSSYAWGVGQTRSTPIHHQFGRGGAAMIGGGNGAGFRRTPYWPQSTDQFGVYPVRGPW
ncbi:hypothetical protein [Mariniblastus fucicola]|uniref:Uncharacterized protein n=1 Tax=Mariniblastus fucicola TaxID=980251 RepID=A0A5B9PPX3_9BACT|nr:hypothetical protein [Mariniblastus fucicola]QEG24531.1 hypothetical protein MFFC18_44510 [Mariniblastus fucicola]